MINIEFQGLPEALRKLEMTERTVRDRAMRVANNKASNVLAREIRNRTPVGREGALRTSIGRRNLKAGELVGGAEVGSLVGPIRKAREIVRSGQVKRLNQFYKAWFIEFGTKKMSATPFIGPAQDVAFPQMQAAYEQAVDDFLTRIYGAG